MNQRVVDKPALQSFVSLPETTGALVPKAPQPEKRALVASGPLKGLDLLDVERAGLAHKRWIGMKPVKVPPADNRSFLRNVMVAAVRNLMKLWYDVRVVNKSPGLEGPIRGALLLIAPHTGLDDPPIVYSNIWRLMPARPVATEGTFTDPFIKRALQSVDGLPVPSTDSLAGTADEMKLLTVQISSALRAGHNIGVHVSGELMRDKVETIGANSLVAKVLELQPEARLIGVVPRGLNGSPMTVAGNGGHFPDAGKGFMSYIGDAIYNLRHFKAASKVRRPVTLEIHDLTEKLRAAGSVREQNAIIEGLSNEPDPRTGTPHPAWYVPRRFDDPQGVHVFESPERPRPATVGDVDLATLAAITDKVADRLSELTGVARDEIMPDRKLADLGLDSISIADKVQSWVNSEFKRSFATPEAFVSVLDVIEGASGQLPATAGIEFKPVSDKFVAQAAVGGPCDVQPGAVSVVDGFLKAVRAEPNRIIGVDEKLGEYTYRDLAILVSLILPSIEKLPGKNIGLMFPNSIMGSAVQIALNLAGKMPAMLNPQWNDEQAKSAMDLVGAEHIITSQLAIRSLKGKKELDDADRIAKGKRTAAEVEADPTRTPFASIEERFVAIEDIVRHLNELRAIDAKLRVNSTIRKLESKAASLKPTDAAVALFTSGSTGNPKGIVYSHAQVMHSARALAKRFALDKTDVLLHLAPSFHLVGYTAGMMATLVGIPTVYVPDPRAAAVAAETGRLRKATITVATPTLANVVANAAGAAGLESLKRVVVGAEPLSGEIANSIRRAAPSASIVQGYGSTEAGVTFVEAFESSNAGDRSLGQALDGVEYILVNAEKPSELAAPGAEGLLLMRGPTIVTPENGYIGKAPDDAFATVDGKTYYVSGDIVRRHNVTTPEGATIEVVQFVDRASRFSKINGEIIPHRGLESVIANVLPETKDGTPRVMVVEGKANSSGVPQLIAYVVAGRDSDGKPVDVNGKPLTFNAVRDALLDAYNGDSKFTVSELRLVPNIELLGTGKVNLGLYKKAGQQPHDGVVLSR